MVEQLSRGEVGPAIQALNAQGRIHEIADREDRLAAIAGEYLKHPDGTLVVSPDNQSRTEINQEMIHRAMQRRGHVDRVERSVRVLAALDGVKGPLASLGGMAPLTPARRAGLPLALAGRASVSQA